MGTSLGDIFVKLKLDSAQFITGMKSAKERLSKLQGEFKKVGAAMTATSAIMGVFVTKSIRSFAGFEEAITKAGAVTRTLGTKDFAALEAQAKKMGATTRFTATQSAEAMKNMGMAGLNAKQIITGIPHVLNLASAGALDLASSADIVTNIMSGFGKEAKDLGEVNDMLVNTFTRSNVDLLQMGESFKMVGPIAKAAGVSINETSAIIGMLGNVGIKGTMAGVALKEAISSIVAPTGEAKTILKALGVEVIKNSDGTMDFAGTLEQFKPIANDAGLMLKVFGRSAAGMAGLLSQGTDSIRELTAATFEQGAASEIAGAMNKTLSGQFDLMRSSVDGAMMSIGQALLPSISKLIGVVKSAFDWFNDLSDSQKEIIAKMLALSVVVVGLGGSFSILVGIVSKLAIIMTGVGGIIVAAATLSWLAWDKWGDDIMLLFNDIKKFAGSLASEIKTSFVKSFSDWTGITEKRMNRWVDNLLKMYKKFIESTIRMIPGAGAVVSIVKQAKDALSGVFGGGEKGGATTESKAVSGDAIKNIDESSDAFKRNKDSVKDLTGETKKLKEKLKDVYSALGKTEKSDVAKDVNEELSSLITDSIDRKTEEFESAIGRARDAAQKEADLIEETRKNAEQAKSDFYAGQGEKLLGGLGSAGEVAKGAMQGAQAGGPMGAVAGAGVALLMKTESFKEIVTYLNDVVDVLVSALEPLVEAFMPIAAIVGELVTALSIFLMPVIKILSKLIQGPVFEVLRAVAMVISYVFLGIGKVWNWIINTIAKVLSWIPKYGKDLSKKIKKYRMDVDSLGDSVDNLKNMTTESAKAHVKAATELEESTKTFSEQLTNIPQGFKIALRRFESTEGIERTNQGIGVVNVNAANPADFWSETKKIMESSNFVKTGSTVKGTGQYSVSGNGSVHAF